MAKHKDCLQVIPNAYVACGEGGQYCSEACMLLAALEPFAKTASAHGVNKPTKDDLWVSLGVASSAWVAAMKAFKAAGGDYGSSGGSP